MCIRDSIGTIAAASYFQSDDDGNVNDVRAFILKQRDQAGTLANNGVPVIIVCLDGMEVKNLRMTTTNQVISTGGPTWTWNTRV